MLRRIGLTTLFAMFLSSCSGGDNKNPTAPSVKEVQSFKLKVAWGEGVSGQPAVGEYEHSSGSQVSYNFSLVDGFRNLHVEAGSKVLASSGSISVSSDTALFATAERAPEESPQAKLVGDALDEVITSSDSASAVGAFGEYISVINSLYSAVGGDSARGLVLSASRESYSRTSGEGFDKSEELLGGSIFLPASSGTARNLVPLQTRLSDTDQKIVVIPVNGILTAVDGPAIALSELSEMFASSSILAVAELYAFYNTSGLYTSKCVRRFAQLESYALWRVCGWTTDLSQALRQVASTINTFSEEAEPEARVLAKIVSQERAQGKRVILLPHSQGNLMVRQALDIIGTFDPCIAVVSLASPVNRVSMKLPETHLDGFVVSGDLILSLGANDFQKVETELSRRAVEEFAKVANTSAAYLAFRGVSHGERLHSMTDSYLAAAESRALLKNILERQVSMLSSNIECSTPSSIRLYASSGRGINSGPSDLWMVPPYKLGVDTLVARIRTSSEYEPVITDIAEHPNGDLWGVSFHRLYKIDKGTAIAVEMERIISMSANSLAFSPAGDLYIAGTDGSVMGVDVEHMRVFWRGDFGSEYDSAGDMAFAPDGRWYALVEDRNGNSRFAELSGDDGRVIKAGEPIAEHKYIFGLAFAGNVPFGFTADLSGQGSLLRFDRQSGQPAEIRKLGFSAFGAAGSLNP